MKVWICSIHQIQTFRKDNLGLIEVTNNVVLIPLLCFSCPVTLISSSTFLHVCHQLCQVHLEPESLSGLYPSCAKLGLPVADSGCTWTWVFLIPTFHPTFGGYSVQPTLHCCSLNRNPVKEPGLPPAPRHPSSKAMNSQSILLQLFNASLNLCFVKKHSESLLWPQRAQWHELELPRALQVLSLWNGQHNPHSQGSSTHKGLEHLCRTFLVGFLKAGTFSSQLSTKDLNFHNYPNERESLLSRV